MGQEKKTQYGGDVVMFLLNKIIKNKKLNYPQKNKCWSVHMVLKPCARPPKQPMFYCTWFRRALQMVLKPCGRPPIQPMVLLYMV